MMLKQNKVEVFISWLKPNCNRYSSIIKIQFELTMEAVINYCSCINASESYLLQLLLSN